MDRSTLEAALIGYEFQLKGIEEKIAVIRAQLGGKAVHIATTTANGAPKPRRTMSAAARKRIAAAQRKRWAEFHAKNGK